MHAAVKRPAPRWKGLGSDYPMPDPTIDAAPLGHNPLPTGPLGTIGAGTAQQIVNAFPNASAPSFLLRGRDTVYGPAFRHRVKGVGTGQVLTAPFQPVAEPVRGAAHRFDPARVPRPLRSARRAAPAA